MPSHGFHNCTPKSAKSFTFAGHQREIFFQRRGGDDEVGLRVGAACLATLLDKNAHQSIISSLIGRTRRKNMGRTLSASHGSSSARRSGSLAD